MAEQTHDQTRHDAARQRDYVVALTRLFIEALNARDFESMRVLVSEDVEVRGPNGSSLRGYPAASELLEACAHIDLVVVRTALEELDQDDDATRVTTPIRELIRREELFRTARFRVRDGAIISYETLSND
jgi:ketosteroid isomerase-like protein